MPWKRNISHQGFTKAQRAIILQRDPICRACGTEASTEVDHITGATLLRSQGINPNTMGNGQGLCRACHHAKTLQQAATAQRKQAAKLKHPSAR